MRCYKIIMSDNQGSFAIQAIAQSCGGQWRDTVNTYDGLLDMGFIDVDDDGAELLELLLDDDQNVLRYEEIQP